MKRLGMFLVLISAVAFLGACAHCQHCGHAAEQGQTSSAIYWCGAADGPASGVGVTPGTCPDGTPKSAGHAVFIEGTTALVCTCGAGCSCKIDPNDHSKCGCGKPVRKVELAGSGLFYCNCMGACGCGVVSAQPGKCKCGMELKQAK